MPSTAIDRRRLLRLLAGGLAGAPLVLPCAADGPALYLAARAGPGDEFRVSGFHADGRRVFDLPLPARGHSFAARPEHAQAVLFARRPGTFARVIDLARGRFLQELRTPRDRHFQGHGSFSPDGRLLYASENDYAAGRGVVGVYDAADDYRRLGELDSHGIGPHELRLLADGETLVVANGGIRTHPELPRVKLNLPDMRPSLVYMDRRDGRLLQAVRLAPELHQLGIRHLAIGHDDTVALAMQYEGPAGDRVPLVATHRRGGPLRLLAAPHALLRAMKHYCGSAAFDRAGRVLAVSAPRGNLLTFWDVAAGRHLLAVPVADGCGVAAAPRAGEFLVSSGRGGVALVDTHAGTTRPLVSDLRDAGRWDNHLVAVRI